MPDFLQKNLGDVLWAAVVFFLFGFLFPHLVTWRLAALSFVFSFCIEVSKRFHASWFDTIRATERGQLIFGYVFGWGNLVCYFTGIALGASWDTWLTIKEIAPIQSNRLMSSRLPLSRPSPICSNPTFVLNPPRWKERSLLQ
jgi:hypothetical protein